MKFELAPPISDLNLRAHFLSDTHLFQRLNGAAQRHVKTIFSTPAVDIHLVGDVCDFEHVYRRLNKAELALENFPREFSDVLEFLTSLKKKQRLEPNKAEIHLRFIDALMFGVDAGKNITMYRGNHDDGLAKLEDENVKGIAIKRQDIFTGAGGKRYQVEHGQWFDAGYIQKYSGILYGAGSEILESAMRLDGVLGLFIPPLKESFVAINLTKKLGKSLGLMKRFRKTAAAKAFSVGADGVICGHIHSQDDRDVIDARKVNVQPRNGEKTKIRYLNIGDGQTHGSSLVQTEDGIWAPIVDTNKQLPSSANDILEDINPYARYRPDTTDFLQVVWEAHLEFWRAEAAMEKELEAELLPA